MGRFREYLQSDSQQPCNEGFRVYDHEVAYLYRQDIPVSSIKNEIEATYGPISFGEIYRALRRNGIQPARRTKPFRNDVLTFDQSGLGLEEIAKLTGYSKRQVRNILNAHRQEQDGYFND